MNLKIVWIVCLIGLGLSAQADEAPIVNGVLLYPYGNYQGETRLSGGDLAGADLTGANLTGADLSFTLCPNVIFRGANLNSAICTNANFSGADFTGAYLTGAVVGGANFTGADLSSVVSGNITDSPVALPLSWQLIHGYLIGPTANLSGADFSGADLSGVDLSGVDFSGADLREVDLNGADLSGADLSGADLSFVSSGNIMGSPTALPSSWRLIQGYLIGSTANLSGADLSGTDLSGVELSNANLSGANLSSVISGNITGSPSALPVNWQLIQGYLVGPFVNLAGADLVGADLTGVDLTGAVLTDADLSGADVSGTWMEFLSKSEQELIETLNGASSNMYTLAEIMDVRPGSSLFAVSNDVVSIGLILETSTNLVDWVSVSNTPAVHVPADSPVKFFRYRKD